MQKKKIILCILLILSLILLIILSYFCIKDLNKHMAVSKCAEEICKFDASSPFSIDKIVYFSSANATSTINSNSSFTINDLYQYTDIAIFINNHNDGNFSSYNTLKKVTLSDISFSLEPAGTPNIYFKNINDFASNKFDENNKIENSIEFETSSEDEIDFSKPILFNNSANPITLCYVNSNIKNDYTLTDNIFNISYDGSLLKRCNITLNSIACKVSFLITIINHLDEAYTCPIIIDIPLSTESKTIYDGSLILNDVTNYQFIKTQR